ncbi:MAG TPA: isoleucine--tRNA ligase [Ilumatobacteraceae bacterium]
MTRTQRYPAVDPQPDLPKLEQQVLEFWQEDGTFAASIDARPAGENGANEFVFYDGPPFANGLPHYGHLLTGYVKDVVPRYRTMRGRRVERRFGWDCHGLPAEVETEKELGISGHPAIIDFGVDRFNAACRTSVLRYTDEWERYVTRQARWVDFENDYKTLDLSYMESVMWAFKTLWDKGLVYEGFKVLPYCWRCETPLSNTETRMDDVYRDRQDPALTVWFELEPGPGGDPDEPPTRVLAWTTTPWTLPSNLALAVGPDIEYAVLEQAEPDGTTCRYVLAAARVAAYAKELGNAEQVSMVLGSELVGRRYSPLFPFFVDQDNAFRVLAADFVTTEDGTGVVHMSPGHGENDQIVCNAAGIATVAPMDEHGRYTSEVPPWAGEHVFDANPLVIRDLKTRGRVLRHETYDHPYPHCWRCAQPLVYRAISSWFVQVTAFKERMIELNESIRWVPEHLKEGSFGKWLANARDWSISRNRFWGSPIPVWKSDDPRYPRVDVYGSLDELRRDFGAEVGDLHRPAVDELVRPNPDDPTGQSTMRRVTEVLDCWFESGSMPFAQVHYPFENRDWFEHHHPGDFIVEYIGQTRGWFYTLHVLATALFDRPAFTTCVSHGIVLGNDGQKASKSLRNYPDPFEMFDTYGSDAVRWFLMSSAILRGTDLSVTEQGIRDAARQVILPLWNSWYFFTLYANAGGLPPKPFGAEAPAPSTNELDRYVLAKLHDLTAEMTAEMDADDFFDASAAIRSFLEVVTNWYIRRSRDRFWRGDQAAFDTLGTVLEAVCRLAAPLLPLVTESIYRDLVPGARSVHLTDWPSADQFPADPELVAAMDRVRDVCSATLSVRKREGRRVRLPLAQLTVASPDASALAPFRDLIADEVNVKHVELTDDVAASASAVLQVVPAVAGPRLGSDVQKVIRAVRAGEWTAEGDTVRAGGITLQPGEFVLRLVPANEHASAALAGNDGVVTLDLELTPELQAEGLARDLVRVVQQARRDAGLDVSDRIALTIGVAPAQLDAVSAHQAFIAGETLATAVSVGPIGSSPPTAELDGEPVHVTVVRS